VDIITRAVALIKRPAQEWQMIAAEPADMRGLMIGYAAPLALVPAVCGLIGTVVLGNMFGGALAVHFSTGSLLLHAVFSYVVGLVGLLVLGKIIENLAPRFGGVADEVSAMKLAVYSATASWLAGVFMLIPVLGILSLLGLYSLYLLYTGAPIVTRVSPERAGVFTLVVIASAVVLYMLVGWLAAMLFLRF
jgi:hypothetical protein